MKQLILLLLVIFHALAGHAQALDSFRLDFKNALSPAFSTRDLDRMFVRYNDLLALSSTGYRPKDSTQTTSVYFPLRTFRSDPLYYDHIESLLFSDSTAQRGLALLVIGASGDSAKTKILLKRMQMEHDPALLYWGGMFLYVLGCQETTALFDLLVQNENFGDAHFVPLYMRLNQDSLLHTALNRITSKNPKARILAANSLGFAKKTPAGEAALRKAVRDWKIEEKGYAVFALKKLRVGHLRSLLKPLLSDPLTRSVVLEALVESPAAKDLRYVKRLAKRENTASRAMLNAFYTATKPEAVKYWLYLLRTKTLSDEWFWPTFTDQPLVTSDALLPALRHTLKSAKDPRVSRPLSRALQGRMDAESVRLIVDLLHHPDQETHYWVAEWNKTCRSPILAAALPALIADSLLRSSPLATMAIENQIDTLQTVFEEIYQHPASTDLKYTALTYLATFPKPVYSTIFRELLATNSEEWGIGTSQQAALGLGRLKDLEADELIIRSSRRWRQGSDSNAYYHLLALEMLKTEKAKMEIQDYLHSKEKGMQEIARRMLDNW